MSWGPLLYLLSLILARRPSGGCRYCDSYHEVVRVQFPCSASSALFHGRWYHTAARIVPQRSVWGLLQACIQQTHQGVVEELLPLNQPQPFLVVNQALVKRTGCENVGRRVGIPHGKGEIKTKAVSFSIGFFLPSSERKKKREEITTRPKLSPRLCAIVSNVVRSANRDKSLIFPQNLWVPV